MRKVLKCIASVLALGMVCSYETAWADDDATLTIENWNVVYNEPDSVQQGQMGSAYIPMDKDNCYADISESESFDGDKSIYLTHVREVKQNNTSIELLYDAATGMTNGSTYTISFAVKGDYEESGILAGFGESSHPRNGAFFSVDNAKFTKAEDGDWTVYSADLKYTTGDEVRIRLTHGCDGMYIDNVSVTDADGKEYINNGSFESSDVLRLEAGIPDMWYGSKTYYATTEDSYSGKASLRIKGKKDGTELIQGVEYSTSSFYNVSFYAKILPNTIENLNAAHGSSYKSFDAISIPNGNTDAQPKASALSYEYTLFNEEVFANWHKMMADIIKPYGIPVHSKMQDYLFTFDDYSIRKLRAGTDAELFAEFCDIAGNDACIYNSEYGEGSQISTMMWYDFLASVTDKPVYNSEDHVIEDDNQDYSDKQAQNVRYSLLSGAVHGRSGSSLWTWQEDYSATGLFADVPYSMYLTSKTMLDMARLNNELNALRTAENDVAIFYSKASRQMTISRWISTYSEYEEALKDCYSAVTPLGVKTGFVTERHPEKVNKYKAVILPEVRYIPEGAVKTIADYMRAGGKAVIYGSNTLGYTEYGISKSTDDRQYIKDNAIYVSSQTVNNYATALGTAGLDVVSVKDSSGSVVTGVDVKATEYKGDNLIFITNLDESNKTVYLDDTTKMVNLLTGDESEGELTLVPYEPVILSPVKEEEPGETVVLGENSVEFDVSYTPEASENIKMVVVVKDESGAVIGASYQTLEKVKGMTCEFSGSIDCKNADSLNVVVFDSDTDAIIYRNTIN